jgi:hypothetical protein
VYEKRESNVSTHGSWGSDDLGLGGDTLSNSDIVVDATIVPVVRVHVVLCKSMSLMRTKRDNPKTDITHCRRRRIMRIMGHAKIFHVIVL